jgi:hypothetical protein
MGISPGDRSVARECLQRSRCLSRDMQSAFFAERSDKAMERV